MGFFDLRSLVVLCDEIDAALLDLRVWLLSVVRDRESVGACKKFIVEFFGWHKVEVADNSVGTEFQETDCERQLRKQRFKNVFNDLRHSHDCPF